MSQFPPPNYYALSLNSTYAIQQIDGNTNSSELMTKGRLRNG